MRLRFRPPAAALLAGAVALTIGLTACGGNGAGAGGSDILLRLNFNIDASSAPFFLARERGYYEEAGLNVQIEAGRGSLVTAQTVSSGQDDFGYITVDAAINAITQDPRMTIVAALGRTGPYNVVHHPGVVIDEVEDLFDMHVLSNPNIPQTPVMFGLIRSKGLNPDDLNVTFLDFAAYAGVYQDDPTAVILGRPGDQDVRFKSIDDVQSVTYSDLGLNFYGNSIVTQTSRIEQDPDSVRGFVQASVRGWEESIADPEAAIDALLKNHPEAGEREILLQELDAALRLTAGMGDSEMKVKPIDPQMFAEQVEFMVQYMDMGQPSIDLTEYYTNEFLQ